MNHKEKRRHVRVETSNLIAHELINEDGQVVSRSMGRALNVSRSGILLETPAPIYAESVSLMTVDLDNNLIEIRGKIIYCRETDSGTYQAGISFIGNEEETAKFAVKLIKLYHNRKHKLVIKIAA